MSPKYSHSGVPTTALSASLPHGAGPTDLILPYPTTHFYLLVHFIALLGLSQLDGSQSCVLDTGNRTWQSIWYPELAILNGK